MVARAEAEVKKCVGSGPSKWLHASAGICDKSAVSPGDMLPCEALTMHFYLCFPMDAAAAWIATIQLSLSILQNRARSSSHPHDADAGELNL